MSYAKALKDPKFQNPICQKCIKRQQEKYKDYVDANGRKYNDFAVPCDGIPMDFLTEHEKKLIDPEEHDRVRAIWDPAIFSRVYLRNPQHPSQPMILRWYQEEIIRCSSSRKITRLGRRSGKTTVISIDCLQYAFTNENKKIIIIAPYKAQVEEIFNRVVEFIQTSPEIKASVKQIKQSPYYLIRFHNGCEIRGFSSGTKSGSDAGQVRGQDANRIYIDEADFLNEGDLNAITPILMTEPDVRFWASSTPKGNRSHFWKWCKQMPTFKEFHHPSMVLPHWKEIEAQVRSEYVGRLHAWTTEILADFSEQAAGVFQNRHIDLAKKDYKYQDERWKPGWVYAIGIDWNSTYGTEIVVTGMNGGMCKVVDAINIPKQEWTQLAGMEAVIEMNRKWKPDFVYTDDPGGGTTHVELLRKYGHDSIGKKGKHVKADINLKDIVHLYDYGSSVEVRDPMSGKRIKKKAKSFLVENAARFFEEERMHVSSYDTVLLGQMDNYIIKSRSIHGNIIYGPRDEEIGDHRLDAMMLSLIPYKIHMSLFGKPKRTTQIGITSGFSNHNPDSTSDITKNIAQERRRRMPDSRFDDPEDSLTSQSSELPANIGEKEGTNLYKTGWDTDEEDKWEAKWRIKRMMKRAQRRRIMPTRSNI